MKQRFVLVHDTARQRALSAVANAPEGMVVEIKEPTKNLLKPFLPTLSTQTASPTLFMPILSTRRIHEHPGKTSLFA